MAEQQKSKRTLKLKEIGELSSRPVEAGKDMDGNDVQFMVRGLSLQEIIQVFLESQDAFLSLYAAAVKDEMTVQMFAPFLLSAPEMVARIIALASDEPESVKTIARLPF